ncbi:MAG: hypothetical protein KGL39_03900 [Patescibacteria group bacterium]|nr:hypothetical protein [Patescibacteria group bacterium]
MTVAQINLLVVVAAIVWALLVLAGIIQIIWRAVRQWRYRRAARVTVRYHKNSGQGG